MDEGPGTHVFTRTVYPRCTSTDETSTDLSKECMESFVSSGLSSLIDLPDNLLPEIEWWIHRSRLSQGVSLSPQNPSLSFMSDASDTGWGATIAGHQFSGVWSGKELNLHINEKELLAIWLGLKAAEQIVSKQVVAIFADNTTALAYIAKQWGTLSWSLFLLAREILLGQRRGR